MWCKLKSRQRSGASYFVGRWEAAGPVQAWLRQGA